MRPRRWIWILPALLAAGVGGFAFVNALPRGEAADRAQPAPLNRDVTAVRLRFGMRDTDPTDWSGSVKVAPGRVVSLEGWRFEGDAAVQGATWKAGTRRQPVRVSAQRGQAANMPMMESGVIIRLTEVTPETRLEFETAQGNFSVALSDLAFGRPASVLQGKAVVERVGDSQPLAITPEEEDFPTAAVAPDGTTYVAYTAFAHAPAFASAKPVTEEPKDYGPFDDKVGGDRIWLLSLKGTQWSKPVAVTNGGEDLFRPAVAADGTGRAWVFFSRNTRANAEFTGGDWELYARPFRDGQAGAEVRLTQDAGADVYPAAATDAEGRVWVVWQAFRGGNSRILAARQEGDGFGAPMLIADTPANEWSPAIATTPTAPAQVGFAWDSYAKGDYDVTIRNWQNGRLEDARPAAASLDYEARPSLACDGGRRLWVAWEQSGPKWGKDNGRLAVPEKKGIGLYAGRKVSVRVLDGTGKWSEPAGDLVKAFGVAARMPGQAGNVQANFARLAADRDGRVWLAARVVARGGPAWMSGGNGPGTVWLEYVTCHDGQDWAPAEAIPDSDNTMDNRPALAPMAGGGMLVVGAADGRRKLPMTRGQAPQALSGAQDPVNSDLFVTPLPAPGPTQPSTLTPIEAPTVAAVPASSEPADVRRARAYRTTVNGKEVRILRGEFHRHTEISWDGGGDGPLEDMWRYALDTASMDWIGNGDHDAGQDREYPWWIIQKTTDIFTNSPAFTGLFSYERSCSYPDGHRNPMFVQRGVRVINRLQGGKGEAMDNLPPDAPRPHSPDTQMLYHYLLRFDGICALHTSATDHGSDWRDSHHQVEPIVEIFQGCRMAYERPGAPRAPTAEVNAAGYRPLGFISRALSMGIRLGFECSSDHGSTHISYCNAVADQPTRESIFEALKNRHVYGSTDNIVAMARWTAGAEEHLMGDEFKGTQPPTARVHLEGSAPFSKISIVKDDRYVYTSTPGKAVVDFAWTDNEPAKGSSYYYIRGEQADGELVWISPVWITFGA